MFKFVQVGSMVAVADAIKVNLKSDDAATSAPIGFDDMTFAVQENDPNASAVSNFESLMDSLNFQEAAEDADDEKIITLPAAKHPENTSWGFKYHCHNLCIRDVYKKTGMFQYKDGSQVYVAGTWAHDQTELAQYANSNYVIVQINDDKVSTDHDLRKVHASLAPGDDVVFHLKYVTPTAKVDRINVSKAIDTVMALSPSSVNENDLDLFDNEKLDGIAFGVNDIAGLEGKIEDEDATKPTVKKGDSIFASFMKSDKEAKIVDHASI